MFYWADSLCNGKAPVPVFEFRKENDWVYLGDYKARKCTNRKDQIERYTSKTKRTDVVLVVFMDPAD